MKRIYILLIVMLLGIGLAGCNSKEYEKIEKAYILREAYELNLLSKDDLENIAYYYNKRYSYNKLDNDEFNAKPKNPEYINANIEKNIKKFYLKEIINEPNISINYVNIYAYYGTYNRCVVVGITDSFNAYDYVIEDEYILDGVSFYKFYEAAIRVFVLVNKE